MKTLSWVMVLAILGLTTIVGTADEPATFYVQLIRGDDGGGPPSLDSKPIGPKLSGTLRRVFRFKNYWEVYRKEIKLHSGRKTRIAVNKIREVEIELTAAGARKVTAYKDGKPLSSTTTTVGQEMTITGGDREDKTVWFIVVRQDKPSID